MLVIGARQRRPIALGEEREREGDRQEGDRRGGHSRAAAKPHGGEPTRDRPASAIAPPAGEHREHSRDHDRGCDGEEAGQEQQEQRRAFSAREPILVGDAAGERDRRHEQRRDRDEVHPAEARGSRR